MMLLTGTLLLQSFKVLNNNINFSNRNSNYGPGWGHNCFQGKILIGTILLSAFFHIILLLIPMTVINIRPNLIFNTPQLKIYLEKSNKENKLVHSIEKGFTKLAKENDTAPSKKSEERVRGTVLGEPFQPIMQSPIKHRAFDRSSKIIRKKIVVTTNNVTIYLLSSTTQNKSKISRKSMGNNADVFPKNANY